MENPSESARDVTLSSRLLSRLQAYSGPPVVVMEVCGTHTVAVARMGLRSLLPSGVQLISGPGCPVCVTPSGTLDEAVYLAAERNVILATYGDAIRVPGSRASLGEVKTRGADVRVVYSALDALEIARREPGREVVFLGLGFETTSPTVAATVKAARQSDVRNFSVLSAHKALLPALDALVKDPEIAVGAFLCPGHATMVLGAKAYRALAEEYGIPCVVAGFEHNDVLVALLRILDQVKRGDARVENAYPRAVTLEGNPGALRALDQIFERVDARWRGLGTLPLSGYDLAESYAAHDARRRFLGDRDFPDQEPEGCRCADVLRGKVAPSECPLFGNRCTPSAPVGACMVSSEGACGAQYRYREA
jgi:hydrogenase expression/formation protein HypD